VVVVVFEIAPRVYSLFGCFWETDWQPIEERLGLGYHRV
jgi:hypothetical protein